MLTADDYRSVSPYWRAAIDAATAAGLGDAEIDSRVNAYMARTGATGADQGWWSEQAVRRVLGLDADPAIERAQQNAIAAQDATNKAGEGGFLGFLDKAAPYLAAAAFTGGVAATAGGAFGAAAPGGSAAFNLAAENIALAEASGGTLTTSGGALSSVSLAAPATMSAYDLAAENIALADASGGALETVGGALQPASGLSLSSVARTAYDLTRTALGTVGTAAQVGAAFNRASVAGLPKASGIAPGGGAGQSFTFSMPGSALPNFNGSPNSLGGQLVNDAAALPVASFSAGNVPTVAIVAAMLAAVYFFARR